MQAVQTRSGGPYNGNGVTTSFPYGFRILDESELEVTLYDSDGVPTVQTLTTHYTVSGVGDASGGSFTMVTAPAVGEQVRVKSITTAKNELDLSTNGDLLPEETELQLDRLTMVAQDQGETLGRSLRAPAGDSLDDMPGESARANKVLSFDADGNPVAEIEGGAIASAATNATNAAASAAAAAVSETNAATSESNAAASAAAALGALSGAGFRYAYSTTTADADPGAGIFRLNAVPGSATEAYFDNLDADGADISGHIDAFDDVGKSTLRGILSINGVDEPAAFATYGVTGTVVDGTGYRKLTLSLIDSSGTWTDGDDFLMSFAPGGADGADGGGYIEVAGAPGANDDDSNTGGNGTFAQGWRWYDTSTGVLHNCRDASTGAAVWDAINPAASEGEAGAIEIATQAEVDGGTDDARAVTPLKLAAWSKRAFEAAASWTHSVNVANVDFTDLDVYDELLIIGTLVKSTTLAPRLYLSDDNGSTFLTGASDYLWLVETTGPAASSQVYLGNTNTATAYFMMRVSGMKAAGLKTFVQGVAGDVGAASLHSSAYTQAAAQHDAIRIAASAGSFIAGSSIEVYGR